jgi:CHAT domain-containing protein/Tfp pilus assembly protein PilF
MIATRQRVVVVQILLVWLLGCCHAPRVLASNTDEPTAARAQELLDLSDKQNHENHLLALQTAKQALDLWKSVGDNSGIALTLEQIGRCYFASSDFAEATRYYQEALQIWRQQNKPADQANNLIMLGYIEQGKGDWLNAISYLTQAQALVDEKTDPELMGQIASGLGSIFNDNGMPETALLQYRRALHYYRLTENTRADSRMIMAIGYTYLLLRDTHSSLTNLEQALAGFDPSGLDAAECHEYIGQVQSSAGEFAGALHHLEPSLAIYERANNPRQAARVRALIGQVYQQQGKMDRARKSYLDSLQIFRRISDQASEAAVCFLLGKLELLNRNYDAAEEYLKGSIEDTENIRGTSSGRDFTTAISASVHERYAAYIECLIRKHQLKPSETLNARAFQASELLRARSLAEFLRDTQIKPSDGLDRRLVEQDQALRQSIRARVDQRITLLANSSKTEELNELETSLARLTAEHERLAEKIRQTDPSYYAFTTATAYSLDEIQKNVIEDDQTALVEYLVGPEASYVWLVTRNDIKVYELPREKLISEAVRRIYDLLSTAPGVNTENRLKSATDELAHMVLDPLAGQLNASRVIVVADGALNYIPFQLLPAPSGNREPLVADYEVINVPSATILGQLRQQKQHRRPSTKVLAAFGDPVFASNYAQFKNSTSGEVLASGRPEAAAPWQRAWRDIEVSADPLDPSVIQPLIYSKFELKNLRDIAGPDSFVARGFDASRQVLEKTDLSKYAILHFATHGLLNPKTPELSGFFLSMVDAAGQAQNGFITMQDVYGLHAPVDLVVLSACRTGLGKDVKGEGLIGLTRGFMYAGASSVVASLWKVDDEATAELMKHFYANMLQKGMRPAAALRAAQNTLRQNPEWQSPHFWASFTLQGEFKQPIRLPATTAASPKVQTAVGAGLLLSLLAGIGWGYWRRRS